MEDWNTLCHQLHIAPESSTKWWEIISSHYFEPWRHYHTLQHITDMLSFMTRDKDKLHNWMEVALAIFFHDVIYDPKSVENEEKSAELFRTFSEECLVGCSIVNPAIVENMIIQTKSHCTDAHSSNSYGSDDVHWLLDCDMSIIGRDESVYLKYAESIRREYSHMPPQEFNMRRSKVLEGFLASSKIYCTEMFHYQYEKKARQNIMKELKSLH